MKIVISPAKSLNFEKQLPTLNYTEPQFLKQATTIQNTLKKKKPNQLSELMDISEKLAELNWQRNQEWKPPFTLENARQAIYAFDGDVYTGLDVYGLANDKLAALQNKLRILSGLYGLLRPLDLMQAYRLEMGTSLPIGENKNLHEFWKKTITKSLNDELEKGELFINLASNEYFSAVDLKTLTKFIYYSLTSVDKVYNNSKYSSVIKLKRPDIIAPVAPVFIQTSHNNKSVELKWYRSTSDDVEKYELHRINFKTKSKHLVYLVLN